VGGVLGRLAARNIKGKVIYAAHGFHFYRGAPFINWVLYYPIEKLLVKYTDCLITINREDYELAKRKFRITFLYSINGVGVDLQRFHPITKMEKAEARKVLGYKDTDFIIINVAEINRNKNQIMLVKSLPELIQHIQNLKVLFAGHNNYGKVRNLVKKLNLFTVVEFLGYRNDIDKLMVISDSVFSASKREGLPINIVEAMACGIPVVCSKNRGHNELIKDKISGLQFSVNKPQEMVDCILTIYKNQQFAENLIIQAMNDSKEYSISNTINKMAEIYLQYMQKI
jgi:glycosyltransferase EpsD